MKINKLRIQTASKRPGKIAETKQNKNIGFLGGIDDPVDIERCLSCRLESCDGDCSPRRYVDNLPSGFSKDLKSGMSTSQLCKKYKIGSERVRMCKKLMKAGGL